MDKNVVKGYQRRVIVVKGADNGAFEHAYFVLRRETEHERHTDRELLAQADLMIAKNHLPRQSDGKKHRRLMALAFFFGGFLTGGGLAWLLIGLH